MSSSQNVGMADLERVGRGEVSGWQQWGRQMARPSAQVRSQRWAQAWAAPAGLPALWGLGTWQSFVFCVLPEGATPNPERLQEAPAPFVLGPWMALVACG